MKNKKSFWENWKIRLYFIVEERTRSKTKKRDRRELKNSQILRDFELGWQTPKIQNLNFQIPAFQISILALCLNTNFWSFFVLNMFFTPFYCNIGADEAAATEAAPFLVFLLKLWKKNEKSEILKSLKKNPITYETNWYLAGKEKLRAISQILRAPKNTQIYTVFSLIIPQVDQRFFVLFYLIYFLIFLTTFVR